MRATDTRGIVAFRWTGFVVAAVINAALWASAAGAATIVAQDSVAAAIERAGPNDVIELAPALLGARKGADESVKGVRAPPSRIVFVHDSLQAALDRARPGDTVFVSDGVYTGSSEGGEILASVAKDDLTLVGSRDAVIDVSGFEYGLRVGDEGKPSDEGCPQDRIEGFRKVRNFRLFGLTFKNAGDTAVRLVGVERYEIAHGRYIDNKEYGPFPVCSTDGRIHHNFAAGHDDAAIYAGNDIGVRIHDNIAMDSALGVEIENTSDAVVADNRLEGNTTGILVVVLPGLPFTESRNVVIEDNLILRNNLPNPQAGGGGVLALLPSGTGILNIGGDGVIVRRNTVVRNNSVGIGSVGNPVASLDSRIAEPFVDGQEVRENIVLGNGDDPDTERSPFPGVDMLFVPGVPNLGTGEIVTEDPDVSDNCFFDNIFDHQAVEGITEMLPCAE